MESSLFNVFLYHDVDVLGGSNREIRREACCYYDDMFNELQSEGMQVDHQFWRDCILRDINHDAHLVEEMWREAMEALQYCYDEKKESHGNDPRMLDRLGALDLEIDYYHKKIKDNDKKMTFYRFLKEEIEARSASHG